MKKITKLRICDWTLLCLSVVILASGLQLEINPNGLQIWVWGHIVVGTAFISVILWHLGLHHDSGRKTKRGGNNVRKRKNSFPGVMLLLTFLSSAIATIHWIGSYVHSTIGGIHGKIGFLFIIAIIAHVRRHSRFYYS